MKLKNPKLLKKGDCIGIISPSAGIAKLFPHRVENGAKMMEKMGFRIKFSKHAFDMNGYVSASAKERADDIHEMFLDNEVKAIICTIGGNHANQVLKYLDFDLIKKNPKVFVGYSDITILHYAFAKKAGLRTFYGPCVMPEFGEFPEILPYTREHFEKAVMKKEAMGKIDASTQWTDQLLNWFTRDDLKGPRLMQKNEGYQWWKEGVTEGDIFGGTIPTINHLAGTEYWVDMKDKIMFLDIPEGDDPGAPFSQSWLDSFFADFDNLGIFDSIKGLVIGRPYHYGQDEIKMLKNMIMEYTKDCSYPILYNANIGHASPMVTIPMGVKVRLNSKANNFEIEEAGVE